MEVKRKPNESVTSLMRRFSRLAQQTKIVANAKNKRSRKRKPTARIEKNRAIMGMHLRKLRSNLEKLGKYSEENFEEAKRRLKQEIDL